MKTGFLSSEFWLIVLVGILTNLGAVEVPDKYKWIVNLLLVVGYAISRGLAKFEYPDVPSTPVEAVDPVAAEEALQNAIVTAAKSTNQKAIVATAAKKKTPRKSGK